MSLISKNINPILIFVILANMLNANPEGADVVSGTANINLNGNILTITNSNRAIINWNDFSINAGETTSFVQPDITSSILNRVVGGNMSEIHGTLSSNGNVYLINPQGILVGSSGIVDTAGFVASTLDVNDSAFLAGEDLTFKGDTAAGIQNLGVINAGEGDVYLIAHDIDNAGTITALSGTANLFAGDEVMLAKDGKSHTVRLTGEDYENRDLTAIENSGVVQAAQIRLEAAAGNIYSLAVNNSGILEATGTEVIDGELYLSGGGNDIVNAGTISAHNSDGSGGNLFIGDTIYSEDQFANTTLTSDFQNSGTLDVSSENSIGGSIWIAGGQADLGANILANGTLGGGRINVRAEEVALSGLMSATGGSGSGGSITIYAYESMIDSSSSIANVSGYDGGSIYIDGGDSYEASGTYQALGASGDGGDIAVTATNLQVNGASYDASGSMNGGIVRLGGDVPGGAEAYMPDHLGGKIFSDLREADTITTTVDTQVLADGVSGDGGVISVWGNDSAIVKGEYSTKGDTGGLIDFSSTGTVEWGGGDTRIASGVDGNFRLDPKNVVIKSSGTGDHTSVTFDTLPTDDTVVLVSDILDLLDNSIDVTIQANNDITLNNNIVVDAGGAGGNLIFQAGRSIYLNANIDTDNGFLLLYANQSASTGALDSGRDAGEAVIFMADGVNINAGTGTVHIFLDNGAGKTHTDAGIIMLANITADTLFVDHYGGPTTETYVNQWGSASLQISGDTVIDAGTNDVFLESSANDINRLQIVEAGHVYVDEGDDIDFGDITVYGDFFVNAGGDITDSGILTIDNAGFGNTSLTAGGSIVIDFDPFFSGAVLVDTLSDGSVDIDSDFDLYVAARDVVGGDLTLKSGGGIKFFDDTVVTGNLSLNAGGDLTGTTDSIINIDRDSGGNAVGIYPLSVGGDVTIISSGTVVDIRGPSFAGSVSVTTTQSSGEVYFSDIAAGTSLNLTSSTIAGFLLVDSQSSDTSVIFSDVDVAGDMEIYSGQVSGGSGTLSVAGYSVFDVGTSDIQLSSISTNFSTLYIDSAVNVSINETSNLVFGTSTISGTLDVVCGGSITQLSGSDVITVAGHCNLNAVSNIYLSSVSNNFSTVTIESAQNVQIVDIDTIQFYTVDVTNEMTVQATTITGREIINVGGTASFSATGDILLDNMLNHFSTVNLTGDTVTIADEDGINIGNSTITTDLSVTTTTFGNINYTGTVNVISGNTISETQLNEVTITHDGSISNELTLTTTTSVDVVVNSTSALLINSDGIAGDLRVNSTSSVEINSSGTIGGNLVIDASGSITGYGGLIVSGSTTLTSSSASIGFSNVTFNDVISVTTTSSASQVVFSDIAGNLSFENSNFAGNLTVDSLLSHVDFNNVTVSGNLDLTACDITADTGFLVVQGNAVFNAPGESIILTHVSNNFNTVSISDSTNVQIVDIDSIEFSYVGVTNDMSVTAASIIGTSVIEVGGLASFTATGDVIFDNALNHFSTLEIIGDSVTIADEDGFIIGNSTITDELSVITTQYGSVSYTGTVDILSGKSINTQTLDQVVYNHDINSSSEFVLTTTTAVEVIINATSDIELVSDGIIGDLTINSTHDVTFVTDVNVTGNVFINTLGEITSTATVVFNGTTELVSHSDLISFQNAAFNDTLSITTTSSQSEVYLTNLTADLRMVDSSFAGNFSVDSLLCDLDFNDVVVSGDMNLVSARISTDSGSLVVRGDAVFSAANESIFLNHIENDFNTLSIVSANDVTIYDINDITISTVNVENSLSITAVKEIESSGVITMNSSLSTATFISEERSIVLNQENVFNGQVFASTGTDGDVQITTASGLSFGTNTGVSGYTDIGGSLTITAASLTSDTSIYQLFFSEETYVSESVVLDLYRNNVSISGSSSIYAVNDTNITFYGETISISSMSFNRYTDITAFSSVSIETVSSTSIATFTNIGENLLLSESTFAGAVLIDSSLTHVDFSNVTVSGDLDMTACDITSNTGYLVVRGGAVFNASGESIILTNVENDFNHIEIIDASEVTIFDKNDITISSLNVENSLSITAVDDITSIDSNISSTAAINVTSTSSTATFISQEGSISLTQDNFFNGEVYAATGTTGDVDIVVASNLSFGTNTSVVGYTEIGGSLNITTTEVLLDTTVYQLIFSEATYVSNTVTLDLYRNEVSIVGSSSIFAVGATDIIFSGDTLNISDMTFNSYTDVSLFSALEFTSINQSSLNISNTVVQDFLVSRYINTQVVLTNVDFSNVTVSGDLDMTDCSVTADTGRLVVIGNAVFNCSGESLMLTHGDNDFNVVEIVDASEVSIFDKNDITISSLNVENSLSITAVQDITSIDESINSDAAITVTDTSSTSTFISQEGSISLTQDNIFNGQVYAATGTDGDVSIDVLSDLSFGTDTEVGSYTQIGGSLSITSVAVSSDTTVYQLFFNQATHVAGVVNLNLNRNEVTIQGSTNIFAVGSTNITFSGEVLNVTDITFNSYSSITDNSFVSINTSSATSMVNFTSIGETLLLYESNFEGGMTVDSLLTHVDFNNVTIAGSLDMTACRITSDTGWLVVRGDAVFNAPGEVILLDHEENDFASVRVDSASEVTIYDQNSIVLSSLTSDSYLKIVSVGDITSTGVINMTATDSTSVFVSKEGSITLDQDNVFNGQVYASTGLTGDVSISVLSDLSFGTVSDVSGYTQIGGNLSINTVAVSSDTVLYKLFFNEDIHVAGDVNIKLNRNDVLISGSSSTFAIGATNITFSGETLEITDITFNSFSDITQNSFVSIDATSTTGSVTCTNIGQSLFLTDSSFAGDLILDSEDLHLDFNNVICSGHLDLYNCSLITDSGKLVVSGTTTIDGADGSVTLDYFENNFSSVLITAAKDCVIMDINEITLLDVNVSDVLSVTAGSDISGTGVITVSDSSSSSTFISETGSITLDQDNVFNGQVYAATGTDGDVSINVASDLSFGTDNSSSSFTSIGGDLIISTATVSDNTIIFDLFFSQSTNVAGTVDLNLSRDSVSITGSDSIYAVGNTNIVFSGESLDISDITFNSFSDITANSSVMITTTSSTSMVNFSEIGETLLLASSSFAGGMTVDSLLTHVDFSNVTISGDLDMTACRITSETGKLVVIGHAVFNAPGEVIELDHLENDFSSVEIVSASEVTITDLNQIVLTDVFVDDSLTVIAEESIVGTGDITINSESSTATFVSRTDSITLEEENVFNGEIYAATGTDGNVSIRSTSDMVFSTDTSIDEFTQVGGDLTLDVGGDFIFNELVHVVGDFNLISDGSITTNTSETKSVFIGGASNILCHGEYVEIENAVFQDTFSFESTSESTTETMSFKSCTFNSTVSVDTLSTHCQVLFEDLNGESLQLVDSIVNGDLIIDSEDTSVSFAQVSVLGDLIVKSSNVSDDDFLSVDGSASFDVNSASIVLDHESNDFNSVTIVSADSVTINDVNAVEFESVSVASDMEIVALGDVIFNNETTVNQNLSISSSGNIVALSSILVGADFSAAAGSNLVSENGLTVGGTTTVSAGGSEISIANADFGGMINVTSNGEGSLVTLRDILSDIVFETGYMAGDLLIDSPKSKVDLCNIVVLGNLTTIACGVYSEGSITVKGLLDINVEENVNLASLQNDIFRVKMSANSAKISSLGALQFGTTNIRSSLDVRSNGDMTQTGPIKVAGSGTFRTEGDITFPDEGNDFNDVEFFANNVLVFDANQLILNGAVVQSNFNLTAAQGLINTSGIQVDLGFVPGAMPVNDFLDQRLNLDNKVEETIVSDLVVEAVETNDEFSDNAETDLLKWASREVILNDEMILDEVSGFTFDENDYVSDEIMVSADGNTFGEIANNDLIESELFFERPEVRSDLDGFEGIQEPEFDYRPVSFNEFENGARGAQRVDAVNVDAIMEASDQQTPGNLYMDVVDDAIIPDLRGNGQPKGNRGHGNDSDGFDEQNPGKSTGTSRPSDNTVIDKFVQDDGDVFGGNFQDDSTNTGDRKKKKNDR